MSDHSHKGFTTVLARDDNGAVHHIAVKTGAKAKGIFDFNVKKQQRTQKQAFREFKTQMRIAKKAIPLADRAKVNWSTVTNVPNGGE